MSALLYAYALVCGAFNPVHSGFNTTLSKKIGPNWTAFVSTGLATLVLLAALAVRGDLRLPGSRSQVPWWAWGSGLIEAFIVLSQPVVAPRLGVATYTALLITASICMSIVLDHLGALGLAQHPASLGRVAGGAIMIGGMVMVTVF